VALANDYCEVRDGSNSTATVATHKPGGSSDLTEYQAVIIADASGHMAESVPTYFLTTPWIGAAANVYPFNFWNASASTQTVGVKGIWPILDSARAVTGALSIAYQVYRTNGVPSGGTAAVYDSTNSNVANFARLDTADSALSSGIGCKTLPTSITTQHYLFSSMVFPEETNQGSILQQYMNWIPDRYWGKEITLRPGEGIALRQGPVASVGSVGWLFQFTVK